MGTGTGNTGGVYTTLEPYTGGRGFTRFMNIGANDPDTWPAFNGLIGDTYVFDTQLSPVERRAWETQVYQSMGIPEPSSLLLLLAGVLGLLLVRRRK